MKILILPLRLIIIQKYSNDFLFRCVMMAGISILAIGLISIQAWADEQLAKESQNPIGNLISVPLQNNGYFGIGPSDSSAYVLNIQPVIPVTFGNVNLINRITLPVIGLQGQDQAPPDKVLDLGMVGPISDATESQFGLGDITYQAFFGPSKPGKVIWGVGPAIVLPAATNSKLSSDKWCAGPAAVALVMPGKWVVGVLAQNVWSFAGDSDAQNVNKFLFQYFVNYNMEAGWYLTSGPIMTANWEASSGNEWMVPLGGGFGRLVKFGKQPVDFKLQAFWNAVKPDMGPDWSLQFQVKFLFPK
jgi:hypothetical protein